MNVGDKCKVIGRTGVPHFFKIGTTAEILRPADSDGDLMCSGVSATHGREIEQYINITDVQKIESA
jgi:hypothetical protein